jgi:hypothetical protein
MTKIAVHDHERRDSIKYIDGPAQKPIGELPDHQVAVVRNGMRVGRVGRGAGAGVAQRLLGSGRRVELGKHEGKDAWIEKGRAKIRQEPPRHSGDVPATVASQQTGALDREVHNASVAAARGSANKRAGRPETHIRPHRGS